MRHPRGKGVLGRHHWKGRGKIIIPSSIVSDDQDKTCWDTTLILEHRWASGEADKKKLAKGENSFQSQLSQTSVLGVWSREEGKISCISFLSKIRLSGKNKQQQQQQQKHIDYWSHLF